MSRCYKLVACLLGMFSFFQVWSQDSTLTIQDAISMAIEHNFNVRIDRNQQEIAEINNSWAMAGALPQVSATASKSFGSNNLKQKLNNGTVTEKKGSTTEGLAAGIAVNWRVFDGFRMFATKQKLEELQRIGEYGFRKTLNETVYDVITQYYRIVTLNEQLDATHEQITLFEDRLNLSKIKYDIGTGARYEMLEAEVDLNEQKSNLIQIQNSINLAKSSLSALLGQRPDTTFHIADTILVMPLPPLAETLDKIELQNPDMQMANAGLNVLHQTKKEINAAILPSVTLNGFYNFNRSSNSAGFNLFNQTYGPSGNIGLSVPLFNGGTTRKQLQVADVNIRNQQISIEKMKNDLKEAVHNAYINYQSALKTIELETNNLKLASENILIATERYRMLNITSVELRQIQLSYNSTQFRLFNALYQAKTAEAMIALLTGDISAL